MTSLSPMTTSTIPSAAPAENQQSSTSSPNSNDTPPFLLAATDAQRKEYIELESNPNLPINVKRKAEDAWAEKCGEPVLGLYKSFTSYKQSLASEESVRMMRITENLSPAARAADQKVRAITSNETQTQKEMETNVKKELSKLPKKVYYELTFATQ
ncbi:unnamed protein product [Caenorhabditis auriculariae]|uniref:SXP/RAL-2 family protein Ani s 5-like cation-binding domain-containing protein n=1 Tax=Caenorhabditis auriculariae TaxID=2777116 RepID=A0A8S1HN19_9PELO|nr:unnamed protein product [Caenorhabditis auriculariae]